MAICVYQSVLCVQFESKIQTIDSGFA